MIDDLRHASKQPTAIVSETQMHPSMLAFRPRLVRAIGIVASPRLQLFRSGVDTPTADVLPEGHLCLACYRLV